MSLDFVAIDFETANQYRASACSVGLVKFIDGKVVDTFYSLINPESEFDFYNMQLHGITPEMVEYSPNYLQISHIIKEFKKELPLVAHYAPFDMGVIKDSNERYNITDFNANYFDSYYLSRRFITSISYKLNHLAELLEIKFSHHNALEDAKACGELIIHIAKQNSFLTVEAILEYASYTKFGIIDGFTGSGFRKKSSKRDKSYSIQDIIDSIDSSTIQENHIFFNRHACFTGKLNSMERKEAMKLFATCGGIPEKGVTLKTNLLIMGDQNLTVVGDSGKSSKIKKAEKLLAEGKDIQLLGENEFLRMLY
ncbi:exonuclease domain-containing protein [Carnobacterium inhibens]|uniref:DNA polymerase III polC-type n=1 Tax=Carnobacterium inhibens subsp. gilichinskyi TaxID=1266845 RepID=U5S7C3_9LACT|nr:exonuclease domain-containing protein [Carnobacterium inhibens]AGY81099.1 DNA polymerase III subunit epsilon [Carnobacterium inhibens subsp. gilichinskyi]